MQISLVYRFTLVGETATVLFSYQILRQVFVINFTPLTFLLT